MKFFKFGKKDRVLDLTERYKKQQAKAIQIKDTVKEVSQQPQDSSSQNSLGFLRDFAQVGSFNSQEDSGDERKRKLAKRFVEMTSKMEDLSNQIYHLQQRVEVLEKKIK